MNDQPPGVVKALKSKWAMSVALHVGILVLIGSCVVIRSKHPVASAFQADLQPTTTEEEKIVTDEAEMPEETLSELDASSVATGISQSMPDILTADIAGPPLRIALSSGIISPFGSFGTGVGKGFGSGTGTGFGTLGGIRVPLNTVVIMDTSGSMVEHNRAIYFEYARTFPNTPLITIPSSKAAQIAEGVRYAVEQMKANSIFVLSDFQDLYKETDPEASVFPLVSFLRSHDVKLYLCSTDKALPKVLNEYAAATGSAKKFGDGLR